MRKKITVIGLVLTLVVGIALMKVAADSTVYAVSSYEDLISGENGATLSEGVITVPENSVITVNGTLVIPDTVTIGGKGVFMRGAALTAAPMFEVTPTGSLTLTGVSVNGGAVWRNSKVSSANNNGIAASAPIIAVDPNGSFTAGAGAKLLNNHNTSSDSSTGAKGGAIYNNGGEVTFVGGTVSFCLSGGSGGAIFSEDESRLILNSGVIFSNTAVADGGAIYCAGGEASLNGVTLLYNTAGANGGAVCTASCSLTMTAGAITGNSAGVAGGGIYPGSLLNIGGSVNIYDNTKGAVGSETASNVYLGEGRVLNLAAPIEENAKIGIDPSVYARNRMLVYGSPCIASNNDLAHFELDDPSVYQLAISTGNIIISSEPIANVYVGEDSMSSCISWEQVISAAAGAGSQNVKIELLRNVAVSQPTAVSGKWMITSANAQNPCKLYSATAESILTLSDATAALTVSDCIIENTCEGDTSSAINAPEGSVRISAATVSCANGSAVIAGGELAVQLSSTVSSASLTQPVIVCNGKFSTYGSTIASSGGASALVFGGTNASTSSNISTTSDVNAAVVINGSTEEELPALLEINGGLISNSGTGAAIESYNGCVGIKSKSASIVGRVRTFLPISDTAPADTHFANPVEVEMCEVNSDNAFVTAQYAAGKAVVSGAQSEADYALYDPTGRFSLIKSDDGDTLVMSDRCKVMFDYGTSSGRVQAYYIGNQTSDIYESLDGTATVAPVISSGTGTFEGWSTENGAGVLVIDDNGALIPDVEGYTDGDGNWVYTGRRALTLYAKWQERAYYLRVLEGEGTGYYYAGQKVKITANQTSNTGILAYYFYYWRSYNGGSFDDPYMRTTYYTMPAYDDTVIGVYERLEVVQQYWNEHGGSSDIPAGPQPTQAENPTDSTTLPSGNDDGRLPPMITADPAKRADALTFIGATYTTYHDRIEPGDGEYSYSHREIPKGGFIKQSGQEDLPEEDLKIFIGATGPDGFVPEGYRSEYYVTDADIPQLGGTIAVLLIALGFMLLSGLGINYAVHLYTIRRVRWKARYRNYM